MGQQCEHNSLANCRTRDVLARRESSIFDTTAVAYDVVRSYVEIAIGMKRRKVKRGFDTRRILLAAMSFEYLDCIAHEALFLRDDIVQRHGQLPWTAPSELGDDWAKPKSRPRPVGDSSFLPTFANFIPIQILLSV